MQIVKKSEVEFIRQKVLQQDIRGLDAFQLQIAYAVTASKAVLKEFRRRYKTEPIGLTAEDKRGIEFR